MPKQAGGAKSKTTLDKIEVAIRALKDRGGQALAKYLKSEFDFANTVALKKAFKTGVDSGRLLQRAQSFTLPGLEFADATGDDTTKQEDLKLGKEDASEATVGATVTMKYVGTLLSGERFDAASKFTFTLGAGEVIKGWERGVPGLRVGGRRRLTVPPKEGYGKRGSPPEIPPDATLVFDITLLKVEE
eukprot:gene6000-7212_t